MDVPNLKTTATLKYNLKYMVRNIVGTLVQVGLEQVKASNVKLILESKDRRKAGPTAEPQGLCLVKVEYPIDMFL